MLRTCIAVVAAGAMAGCVAPPQSGPMPMVCDERVPARVCADWRQGAWRDAISGQLPRAQIVRIEVETVEGDDLTTSGPYDTVKIDPRRPRVRTLVPTLGI
jgi:hypothetical protein